MSPFIFMVMVIQWWWLWGKGGCHPSSSWQWLFSGGGCEEKRVGWGVTLHPHGDGYSVVVVVRKKGWGGVSPFILMVMVIQWWWSWGGKKGLGGGVTLHLHGNGYSVVLVSGCRLRLATVNALQVQPAGLLQAEPFSEQDVVVDPLVVLRCDERVFR